MDILENYSSLEGKANAFVHMAKYANQMTIATTDGCILMAAFEFDEDGDGDETHIRVLRKHEVLKVLNGEGDGCYIRKELAKRGLFDMEVYKKQAEENRRAEMEQFRKQREKDEKDEYERLKAKFENK